MNQTFDTTRHRRRIERILRKKSFCTLATTSTAARPHTVGVRYVVINGALYVNAHGSSVKARNARENPRIAACIPAQKVPFFPPFCIQFQGTAEVLPADDPTIRHMAAAGRFKAIVSDKDLHQPDQVFIRITPGKRMHSYGVGEKLMDIVRAPQEAGRSIAW